MFRGCTPTPLNLRNGCFYLLVI